MKAVGYGRPMLPRRLRALRRSVVFHFLRLPEVLLRWLAWTIALALVLWRRYRVPLFASVVLMLCIVGTISRQQRRIGQNTEFSRGEPAGRRAFRLMPRLQHEQQREINANIEVASYGGLVVCRFHEVCIDGDLQTGLKLYLPASLANRAYLLKRCGVSLLAEFSLKTASSAIHAMDIVSPEDGEGTSQIGNVISRACSGGSLSGSTVPYECYRGDSDAPCSCPLKSQLSMKSLPSTNQTVEYADSVFNFSKGGALSNVCFRSFVSLCSMSTRNRGDQSMHSCGKTRHPELLSLDVHSILAVANSAVSRLQQLNSDSEEEGESAGLLPVNSFDQFIQLFHTGDKDVLTACRVGPACRDSAGVFILPIWMRDKQRMLQDCGFGDHLGFGLPIDAPSAVNADLFGVHSSHASLGYFLEEFLPTVTGLHAAQLADSGEVKVGCFRPNGERGCQSSRRVTAPEVILNDIARDDFKRSWISELVKHLPPEPDGPAVRLLSSMEQSQRICFRSIAVGKPESSFVDQYMGSKGVLYKSLKLSREPVLGTDRAECRITMTIFDYRDDRALVHGVRPIANVHDVKNGIKFKSRSRYFSQYRGMEVNVHVVHPQQRSFADLAKAVSASDVLIGPHGEDLVNLLFLRKGALLVEAFPFGYASGPFDGLAKKLSINHVRALAKPDRDAFTTCLKRQVEDGLREEDTTEMVVKFDRAAEQEDQTEISLEGATMGAMRDCLMAQSLHLHPPSVAQVVMQMGARGCPRKTAAR